MLRAGVGGHATTARRRTTSAMDCSGGLEHGAAALEEPAQDADEAAYGTQSTWASGAVPLHAGWPRGRAAAVGLDHHLCRHRARRASGPAGFQRPRHDDGARARHWQRLHSVDGDHEDDRVFLRFSSSSTTAPAATGSSPTGWDSTPRAQVAPQVCMACSMEGNSTPPPARRSARRSFRARPRPARVSMSLRGDSIAGKRRCGRSTPSSSIPAPASGRGRLHRGLYGNAASGAGTKANGRLIPPDGRSRSGSSLGRGARPHLLPPPRAGRGELHELFNFQDNAAASRAAARSAHSMPNAELQYRDFWLKETGPVYLPGLLAASLGFPSCP